MDYNLGMQKNSCSYFVLIFGRGKAIIYEESPKNRRVTRRLLLFYRYAHRRRYGEIKRKGAEP